MKNVMKFYLKQGRRLLRTLLFGFPVTIWLLLRDRHTVYYIPHVGLGDYCIALGYLDAYKRANNIGHITLIIPPNRREVAGFYSGWDSLLELKRPMYIGLVCFGGIPIGRQIHRKAERIANVTLAIHLNRWLFYHNPAVSMDDLIKLILKIPHEDMRQAPKVPDESIDHITRRYDLPQGKTVLLNPYTSGMAVQEIQGTFYEKLALRLKQEGATVATILGSEQQKPVPGTQGIVASLAESWHLVRYCGGIVGMRSGFFDFVQFSGCNMVAIYDPAYKLRELFSLKWQETEARVSEYIWNEAHGDVLVKDIIADWRKWREGGTSSCVNRNT